MAGLSENIQKRDLKIYHAYFQRLSEDTTGSSVGSSTSCASSDNPVQNIILFIYQSNLSNIKFKLQLNYHLKFINIRGVSDVGFPIFADTDADFAF